MLMRTGVPGEQLAQIDGMKKYLADFKSVKMTNSTYFAIHSIPFLALDPAGPLFDGSKGLNPSCAKFVQVLHTSKLLGIRQRIGHSDFYANRFKAKQPGCSIDTCSHTRATELYYASCFPENVFNGTDCDKSDIHAQFGFYNDGGEAGYYDFDTTKCFPFTLPS